MKKILVTGAAGFIGANLVKRLLLDLKGATIVGVDNMNDYYDVALKEYRLKEIEEYNRNFALSTFIFAKGNIADKKLIEELFTEYRFDVVVNLAAQAGVRYSIDNPDVYIKSNIIGFYNILEACRHWPVEHLVYASSSSVYGGNKKVPFSTKDMVDSLYMGLLEDPIWRILTLRINCLLERQYNYITTVTVVEILLMWMIL